MSSSEKISSPPPVYPTYTATPEAYQSYPTVGQPVLVPLPSPVDQPTEPDSVPTNDNKKGKKQLKELGEVDPASLIPGKGPGGAPQQFFNVS